LKILSVVGTRPNFIKMIPVILEIEKSNHEHLIIHTGQHYDINMSDIFFKEMNLKQPDYNLKIGSGSHGYQTGEVLKKVEKIIIDEEPDFVLVPGDTNSNLAGALAAVKLHFKIGHIEAGLRSFDKTMPEEINRILIDHISSILFCPTKFAIENLINEGIKKGTYLVGDTMFELALMVKEKVMNTKLDIDIPDEFILSTIHRANNTEEQRIKKIIDELIALEYRIVLPLHPRTNKILKDLGLYEKATKNLQIIDPVGFCEFSKLLTKAKAVITDSGGVQKEAYWNKKPCVTIRQNTEWVDTIQEGGNILAEPDEIQEKVKLMLERDIVFDEELYGYSDTSKRIVSHLENYTK